MLNIPLNFLFFSLNLYLFAHMIMKLIKKPHMLNTILHKGRRRRKRVVEMQRYTETRPRSSADQAMCDIKNSDISRPKVPAQNDELPLEDWEPGLCWI